MLSKSSKYAIRAVLYLSLNSNDKKKYNPKDIADAISIPAPFLAKTLQELTKKELISSTKGRNGGFYLTKDNRLNSMLSIIDCIDGLHKFDECFIGLPKCSDSSPCSVHHIVARLKNDLLEVLKNNNIDDFTKDVALGKMHIV